MINTQPKYSYCDLSIVPAPVTYIKSRQECNPYYSKEDSTIYNRESMPIFTAPMDSVADDNNFGNFEAVGITPIIHRNVDVEKRLKLSSVAVWCAYSLTEFERYFCHEDDFPFPKPGMEDTVYVCMDCANGHMKQVLDLALTSKKFIKEYNKKNNTNYRIVLMAGNIANPDTYMEYCRHGIDYARCSIGTGSMCLTSANTAVGYPNASLIASLRYIKNEYREDYYKGIYGEHVCVTKIVADGGIRNYSDAIIALACGADYVMIGGLFAGCADSCAALVPNESKEFDRKIYPIKYTKDETVLFTSHCNRYYMEDLHNIMDAHQVEHKYEYDNGPQFSYITVHPAALMIPEIAEFLVKNGELKKKSHGMSTKEAQLDNLQMQGVENPDSVKLKTSEGKAIEQTVRYTIRRWTENLVSYLKSAMSYTNKREIWDFVNGDVKLVVRSQGTRDTVNK